MLVKISNVYDKDYSRKIGERCTECVDGGVSWTVPYLQRDDGVNEVLCNAHSRLKVKSLFNREIIEEDLEYGGLSAPSHTKKKYFCPMYGSIGNGCA